MLAVNSAFSDRSSALLTVQTLLSELDSLQSRAEKLEVASSKIFGGDKSRIRKLEELKETIKVTEDAKHVAIREYERIKVSFNSFKLINSIFVQAFYGNLRMYLFISEVHKLCICVLN